MKLLAIQAISEAHSVMLKHFFLSALTIISYIRAFVSKISFMNKKQLTFIDPK